jgi:hypothetical protein
MRARCQSWLAEEAGCPPPPGLGSDMASFECLTPSDPTSAGRRADCCWTRGVTGPGLGRSLELEVMGHITIGKQSTFFGVFIFIGTNNYN